MECFGGGKGHVQNQQEAVCGWIMAYVLVSRKGWHMAWRVLVSGRGWCMACAGEWEGLAHGTCAGE